MQEEAASLDTHSKAGHLTTLTVNLTKREEKQIRTVPFHVEPNLEAIRISMKVAASRSPSTIDLGLRDPRGTRGWSGGARSQIVIREETATPGYLPGSLEAGDWAVLLGVYEVPAEGASVELEIEQVLPLPRWIGGDLHSHTVHSDGAFTVDEAANRAQSAGLAFLALTDHNTYSQNLGYPRDTRVLFVPGMELTTYSGHVNLLGVPQPVDDFRVASQADLTHHLKIAQERGALISVNHPFETECSSCAWRWDWDPGPNMDWDAVEVWNGPWREANVLALAWWQSELESGRRRVAIGGSDTHSLENPHIRHGWPTTWVYANRCRRDAILRAIRQGRVFLSYAPSGPTIDLSCGAYRMGDVVPTAETESVTVVAKRLQPDDEIRIVTDRGITQRTLVGLEEVAVDKRIQRHDARFCRVEIWRQFPDVQRRLLAAMSNPLYFGETWGTP